MFRTAVRRVMVGLVASAALAVTAAGSGSVAFAATPDPGPGPVAAGQVSKADVAKEVARFRARGAALAATPPSKWVTDNGPDDTWNGGCVATTHAEYFPGNDQAVISTTVTSPYWFAACRANAQLWIETSAGAFPSGTNYAMGCAVFDPSCASTQTATNNFYSSTPALTGFVDAVNDALAQIGLPRSYSRAAAVTAVRVTHTNAS
ncbi:hypothetical protein [Actinoplanes sp. NPDC026619]|uniref:hypothetical protein n=1 Tax=Actinoplanes sp. NPDC026619 TaxID=3155798 RepID=UPI0033EC6B59